MRTGSRTRRNSVQLLAIIGAIVALPVAAYAQEATLAETTERIEFLIDSGAIYSVVPSAVLGRLGIRPLVEQEFRLADGTTIARKKGVALFKYGDGIGGADVIFGEEGDSVLLGAFRLEALGLVLDPLRRELRPPPMILAFCRNT